MTDPAYGAREPAGAPKSDDSVPDGEARPSVPTSTPTPESSSPASGSPAAPSSGSDAQATTELPRAGWQARSDGFSAAGPSWSSDETRDFPAYRPQSYPTYPPLHAPTTQLPSVGAGGPPPTTAAAYGGVRSDARPAPITSAGPAGAPLGEPARPRRRAGAGLAGGLGLIGIAAAGFGAFGLPVQNLGARGSPYFATLRELATHPLAADRVNAHSVSLAGGHAATVWWRYALMGALAGLALLFLVQICVPVLRRVAGALLFLGAVVTIAGYAFAVHQTNDYRSVGGGIGGNHGVHRVPVAELGIGLWVAVGGCAVAAVGGMIAAVQSTRR